MQDDSEVKMSSLQPDTGYSGAGNDPLNLNNKVTQEPIVFQTSCLMNDGSTPSAVPKMKFRHSNIFPDNKDRHRMMKKFPWLFPYGSGDPDDDTRQTTQSVGPRGTVRHYLRLSSHAFAHDEMFSLSYFDELSMKKGLQAGRWMCDTPAARIAQFDKVTESQVEALTQYEDECRNASKIGEKVDYSRYKDKIGGARQMISTLRNAESHMWGTVNEALGHRNRLWAMWNKFGPPSLFITFNPNDVDSLTLLRMTGKSFTEILALLPDDMFDSEKKPKDGALPSSSKMYEAISSDPAACARYFDHAP